MVVVWTSSSSLHRHSQTHRYTQNQSSLLFLPQFIRFSCNLNFVQGGSTACWGQETLPSLVCWFSLLQRWNLFYTLPSFLLHSLYFPACSPPYLDYYRVVCLFKISNSAWLAHHPPPTVLVRIFSGYYHHFAFPHEPFRPFVEFEHKPLCVSRFKPIAQNNLRTVVCPNKI